MNRRKQSKPTQVPRAQQVGKTRSQGTHPLWRTANTCVWTPRMLTTLLEGVEGGKWFRLVDKVFAQRNLLTSFQQVAENDGAAGVDHVTVEHFAKRLPESIGELSERLRAGTFTPQAIRRVAIAKPGTNETRPLGIPTVRDRIVQTAIVNVIEPIFERDFAEQSYGFRPERGCQDALRRVDELLKDGYVHVADADLKGYFDSIPHDRLMDRLREKIADGSVLRLIEDFLKAPIRDGEEEWTPQTGAPQGAVLSPLLSNIYLDPLDHLLADAGLQMVRYADDFVILARTVHEAQKALELVRNWVAENELVLHPTKTHLVDIRTEGFDFLGYHFATTRKGIRHWVRDKSVESLKESIRTKTKRTSGHSMTSIIADVNRTLRGWFAYFKHSRPFVFTPLDRFVRQRLRAILRKRSHRRGCAKGLDYHRWPNAYFAEQGLFSLVAAHESACQSSPR